MMSTCYHCLGPSSHPISLAFDSNDMQTDDLKNLLPLFLRMRNLEELSFNYNFDMSMVGIDEQLARLLEINKIKKISLRGYEGHRLQEQLVILLCKIGKRPMIILILQGTTLAT